MAAPRVAGPGYRADIDGLRAVAIVLVVAFHLVPAAVPAGFVGVDVFFVVSGFVVTLATLRHETGHVLGDFIGFWRRRIARIYPALVVCIAVTMLAVALLSPAFPGVVYDSFNRTGVAALFGLANVYLARQSTDYFLQDQDGANPFLHTWSLGVEEQFYVLFSVLFILAGFAFLRVRGSSHLLRLVVFGVVTLASLAFFLSAPGDDTQAHFLPQHRLWQLGIGCLLALWSVRRPPRTLATPLLTIVRLVALAVIVLSPLLLGADDARVATLLATAGTALLLALPAPDRVAAGLGSRVARAVGVRSYSLYLWHWPVIVFFAFTVGIDSVGTVTAAIVVTTALAAASYRWVETPLRRPGVFWKAVVPAVGAGAVVTLTLFGLAEARPGAIYVGRAQAWSVDWMPSLDTTYAGSIRATECDITALPVSVQIPAACMVPAASPERPTILTIGDSQSFASWGMFERGWSEGAFAWAAYSHDGCAPDAFGRASGSSCAIYWSTMPERVTATLAEGDILLIAVHWPAARLEAMITALRPVVETARSIGARVLIQAPLPSFERDSFNCTEEWFRVDYSGCTKSRAEYEAGRARVVNALTAFSRENDALVWDPADLLCGPAQCSEFRDGLPLFRDRSHLSYFAARALWPTFQSFLSGQAVPHAD